MTTPTIERLRNTSDRAASTNGAGGFPAPLIKTPGSSRAAK